MDTKEADFYGRYLYFSYSAINLLLFDPKAYHNKYIANNYPEKTEKYLIEGRLIHCLLMEPENFGKNFIVTPLNLPSDSNKKVVDMVFKERSAERQDLVEYRGEILDALSRIGLHQSLKDEKKADLEGEIKTGDDKRYDKIVGEQEIEYWNYLNKKGNKDIIDNDILVRCQGVVSIIRSKDNINRLLGLDIDVFSLDEKYVELFHDIKTTNGFGFKGYIDNVVVRHSEKKIYINDIKTTGKGLAEFRSSIEMFYYWIQAILYVSLITDRFKKLFNDGYRLEFTFVVIDSKNKVYPYRVSEATLTTWLHRFEELVPALKYHYFEKDYDLPYRYAKGLEVL